MMLKKHMLVVFKPGKSYRSMTDSPPLQRAIDMYSRDNDITDIELYKYSCVSNDYKYLCTIKFDRGLALE